MRFIPSTESMNNALWLATIVTALIVSGTLLWRKRAWGYVIAPIAGVQASMYLLVLAVNSVIAVRRGLVESPGEVPLWGALLVFTTAGTLLLLGNVRNQGITSSAPHLLDCSDQ